MHRASWILNWFQISNCYISCCFLTITKLLTLLPSSFKASSKNIFQKTVFFSLTTFQKTLTSLGFLLFKKQQKVWKLINSCNVGSNVPFKADVRVYKTESAEVNKHEKHYKVAFKASHPALPTVSFGKIFAFLPWSTRLLVLKLTYNLYCYLFHGFSEKHFITLCTQPLPIFVILSAISE